jgi:hypothetical protein
VLRVQHRSTIRRVAIAYFSGDAVLDKESLRSVHRSGQGTGCSRYFSSSSDPIITGLKGYREVASLSSQSGKLNCYGAFPSLSPHRKVTDLYTRARGLSLPTPSLKRHELPASGCNFLRPTPAFLGAAMWPGRCLSSRAIVRPPEWWRTYPGEAPGNPGARPSFGVLRVSVTPCRGPLTCVAE